MLPIVAETRLSLPSQTAAWGRTVRDGFRGTVQPGTPTPGSSPGEGQEPGGGGPHCQRGETADGEGCGPVCLVGSGSTPRCLGFPFYERGKKPLTTPRGEPCRAAASSLGPFVTVTLPEGPGWVGREGRRGVWVLAELRPARRIALCSRAPGRAAGQDTLLSTAKGPVALPLPEPPPCPRASLPPSGVNRSAGVWAWEARPSL